MRSLLPPLAALALSACVGYPRVFLSGGKGQAAVEPGHPKTLKAAIVRRCETVKEGERETLKKERTFKTDDQGRYDYRLLGLAWNWRNLITGSSCVSRVQLYSCRDVCRQVDLVDLEALGK